MKRQEKPFDEKIEKFLETVIESGKVLGRDLGFHATDKNITPSQTRVNGIPMEEWSIYGTERDHRDNDNYMAYYSEDYMHVYRTKNPKFMYIVTSCRAAKSGHKKDNTQNWGRAPKLDIIEKIDLAEIDKMVDQMYKNEIEKEEIQKKAA